MANDEHPNALPSGSELHWYRLEGVLGQGGFGITYLARDTNLDQVVAIKEYLPLGFAARGAEGRVLALSDEHAESFRHGLRRFIEEARTLARFDHPNIVRVHSVFEANQTAYMVMRYERGQSLAEILKQRQTLGEAELIKIVLPILDGLAEVHDAGFIHRDITPDNIYLHEDGTPVLLDFGSARQALGDARTLTILVAPGYAPYEQYYGNGAQQGPWTDIYALGATLYRAIAGVAPTDAITRSKGILGSTRDILVAAADVGRERYSERLLRAVDHALAFDEQQRPQSLAAWRAELTGESESPVPDDTPTRPAGNSRSTEPSAGRDAEQDDDVTRYRIPPPAASPIASGRAWLLVGAVVLSIGFGILAGMVIDQRVGRAWLALLTGGVSQPPSEARVPMSAGGATGAPRILPGGAEKQAVEGKQRAALKAELQTLKATREQQMALVVAARAEADRLAATLDSLKSERKGVTEKLTELRRSVDQQQARLATQQSASEAATRAATEARKQAQAALDSLAEGRRTLDTRSAEVADREHAVARRESAASAAEARITEQEQRLSNERETLAAELKQVAAQRRRLKADRLRLARNASKLKTPATIENKAPASQTAATPSQKTGAVGATVKENGSQPLTLAGAEQLYRRGAYREALHGFETLADRGVAAAQYRLAGMYGQGNGAARDPRQSLRWYLRAAEQGYGPAQFALGERYGAGKDGAQDPAQAAKWYRKAAEQGHAEAQLKLGDLYHAGRGVTRDEFQAYAWYSVAAAAGQKQAATRLKTVGAELQAVERQQAAQLFQRFRQSGGATKQPAGGN